MRRTISSAQTFLIKVILPVVWVGVFAAATVFLFAAGATTGSAAAPDPGLPWTFLLVTLLGTALFAWTCIPLKRVELDDSALYISNYRTDIMVLLRDVERVTENRWINSHPVAIHFLHDTEFGTRIVFMPRRRWFAFFSSHPIVAELRAAVARSRGESPPNHSATRSS